MVATTLLVVLASVHGHADGPSGMLCRRSWLENRGSQRWTSMGAPHGLFHRGSFQACADPTLRPSDIVLRAGSIPRDLGRLVALKSLYLGGNNLTGEPLALLSWH